MASPARVMPVATERGACAELIGSGRLYRALPRSAPPEGPSGDGPLVVVRDGEHDTRTDEPAWGERDRVYALAGLGHVLIGPTVRAGAAGCAGCVRLRRAAGAADDGVTTALWQQHRDRLDADTTLLSPAAVAIVDAVLTAEAAALAGGGSPLLDGAVLILDLATLHITRHRFLPVPDCPRCGRMPADSADGARIRLVARPKLGPLEYRTRDVGPLLPDLLETYVDDETGLISRLRDNGGSSFPTAAARLAGRSDAEAGYGRAFDHPSARLIAVAEALERHGGLMPRGRRTAVRATFREVADHAVDPRSLGLYPDDRYALPGFRFRRYHEDLTMDWVWAHSFRAGEPVLVPESYAYYRVPWQHDTTKHSIVFETSNGCALGNCLEEAILHGLLEVAERDAFLMTWHARMPVPRIDLASGVDPALALVAARVTADTGYRLEAFDITLTEGVPCCWAVAVAPPGDRTVPSVVCGSGSSLSPARAVRNALHELAQTLSGSIAGYAESRAHADRLAADPDAVAVMDDHLQRYGHPDMADRFSFLLDGADVVGLDDFCRRLRPPDSTDLRADVLDVVGRYLAGGLDVLVVDQTSIEHEAMGFACVKVIVPGTLPITFGHRHRRLDGLPRLLEVPYRLGRFARPLSPDDVNTDPHPFP